MSFGGWTRGQAEAGAQCCSDTFPTLHHGLPGAAPRAGRARGLPHKAAQRISELKRFLYFRISGVSLWGRMLVGFTFTTEIFRASFSLACSCLSSSLVNRAGEETQEDREG